MSQPRSSFSLASLFLLMAGVSVLLAGTRSAVSRWESQEAAVAWVVAGSVVGALTGISVGLTVPRWFRGAFSGFFIGTATGGMAGAQLAAPPDPLVVIVGIVMLIGISLALRPKLPPPENDEVPTHPTR